MAILEVVLEQSFYDQQIINRWNYVSTGTPAAVSLSFALVSALGAIYDNAGVPVGYPLTGFMKTLASIQNNQVQFVQLSVKDVYSDTDFYETPFVQELKGAVTGESLPPFSAWGFYSNRVRQSVRRGQKRIVGVPEAWQNAGWQEPPAPTNLPFFSAKMSEVLNYSDEGNSLSFAPAICGKEKYLPEDGRTGRYAYRYYATEAEQLEHTALGVVWTDHERVRSQTSRQYGKGR